MPGKIMNSVFCGSHGCCGVTVATNEDSMAYEYIDSLDSLQRSNTGISRDIEDLSDIKYDGFDTDDERETLLWKEEDLCYSHLNSIKQRRHSLSMSNVLDLSGDNISLDERRCTYPPSRTKREMPSWFQLIPKQTCKLYRERRTKKRSPIVDMSSGQTISSIESISLDNFSSKEGLIRKPSKEDISKTTNTEDNSQDRGDKCPLCVK